MPPPVAPLMLIRQADGYGIDKTWLALDDISPTCPPLSSRRKTTTFATIAASIGGRSKMPSRPNNDGGRLKGASTITQQTAKNLFLWPGRSFTRKGIEVWLAILLDLLWSKERVLEVCLNIVEWSGGVYGAEAAAQLLLLYTDHRPQPTLGRVAGNRVTQPAQPLGVQSDGLAVEQVNTLIRRIGQIEPLLDCY